MAFTSDRKGWRFLFAALMLATGLSAAAHDDLVIRPASGEALTIDALIHQLETADFVLLGEIHDNPRHHAARAELIRQLASRRRALLVAEPLQRGRTLAEDGALLPALEAAGFVPENWRWPLHEPLFVAAREAGIPVVGGNIARDEARDIVRKGSAVLPADIADALAKAPLRADAARELDRNLSESHCGMLPAHLLPGMHLAQRARDAAMALALQARQDKQAILVAGNGHVRRDFGVPSLLTALAPDTRTLAVGFVERSADGTLPSGEIPYDFVWITDAQERDDPCRQ